MPLFPETYVIGWPALLQLLWTVVHWKGSMHMLQDPVMIERAWSRSVLFYKTKFHLSHTVHLSQEYRIRPRSGLLFSINAMLMVNSPFLLTNSFVNHPKDQISQKFFQLPRFSNESNWPSSLRTGISVCLRISDITWCEARSAAVVENYPASILHQRSGIYLQDFDRCFRAAWIAIINKSWFLVIVSSSCTPCNLL